MIFFMYLSLQMAFRARKLFGTFEKRTLGLFELKTAHGRRQT